MQQHRQPSDKEIRGRIASVKDKQKRMLYKYQYLTLGRISEVAGKYMPHRDDHRIMDVDGEEFCMFIVKTAKRKAYLRPCARPLDTKYDLWAKEVMEYMEGEDEYPFRLHENDATSKTYAMNFAKKTYDGLWWPMSDYSRAIPRQYTQDMVKTSRWGDKGYEEFLVIFPDGERTWTKDPEFANIHIKIEPRWKKVTSHVLRKISAQSLRYDYGFDDVDVGVYGGWTVSNREVSVSLSKHYMHMDLHETETAIPELKKQALRFAKKLLVPFDLFKHR